MQGQWIPFIPSHAMLKNETKRPAPLSSQPLGGETRAIYSTTCRWQ